MDTVLWERIALYAMVYDFHGLHVLVLRVHEIICECSAYLVSKFP
jgi:hypothetical protein